LVTRNHNARPDRPKTNSGNEQSSFSFGQMKSFIINSARKFIINSARKRVGIIFLIVLKQGRFDCETRAALGFVVNLTYVFAHDTETDKLNAAY
jgi:hypothetical protein